MTSIDKAQNRQVLTSFIHGYMNDMSGFVASKVAPFMPVLRQTGELFSFGHQAMRVFAGAGRAVGGRYKKVDFDVTKVNQWSLVDNGFMAYVYEEELRNKELPIQADQAKLKLLAHIMMLNYESAVAAAITTSTIANYTTPGASAKWGHVDSTPYEDIEDRMDTVRLACGKKPNALLLSYKAKKALMKHADTLERLKYTGRKASWGDVVTEILMGTYGLQFVDVAEATYEEANLGAADSSAFTDIRGDIALLYYRKEQPELIDTQFMTTYGYKDGVQAGSFATTQEQQLTEKKVSGVVVSHERDIIIVDNKAAFLWNEVVD